MFQKVFSVLAMSVVLSSSVALADTNCTVCLQLWNMKTNEVWSCSSPYNPSGGAYGIIDNYDLAMENPAQCGDSRWCAAPCPVTPQNLQSTN